MRIISNSNNPNDRMDAELRKQSIESEIYIASAFFSYHDLIQYMLKNNCNILLVIRLGEGTSPDALLKIIDHPRIDIRFYTGKNFHPKVYIFGNRIAYLGSSNLTKSGLLLNQEANIEIDSDDLAFDEVTDLFDKYWSQGKVLTKEILLKYNKMCSEFIKPDISKKIINAFGLIEFNNVGSLDKKDSKSLFIESFSRKYQRYNTKFKFLEDIYSKSKQRKFPNIPLRIEVDRFLWWIREEKAQGDKFDGVKIKNDTEIISMLKPLIYEFVCYENNYLKNDAIPSFLEIQNKLSSEDKIQILSKNDLFKTLLNVHAFDSRFRFSKGGYDSMKVEFFDLNGIDKIKNTVIYLLFDNNEYELKVFNCLKNSKYKLSRFGDSCVKELYGLLNTEEIPICNGRTVKSMEWLGFGKL